MIYPVNEKNVFVPVGTGLDSPHSDELRLMNSKFVVLEILQETVTMCFVCKSHKQEQWKVTHVCASG